MQFEEYELPLEPINVVPTMPEKQAKEKAFYTTMINKPADVNAGFDEVVDDLVRQGYSQAYSNTKISWANEQQAKDKVVIADLINDPTIDKQTKLKVLNGYTTGDYISTDIRDKYVQDTAILDIADTHIERTAQDQIVADLNTSMARIDEIKKAPVTISARQVAKEIPKMASGEALAIVNLITSLPNFALATSGTVTDLVRQAINSKNPLDWEEAIKAGQNFAENDPLASVFDWRLQNVAKYAGVEREYNNAATSKAFESIGNAIDFIDEKLADGPILPPGAFKRGQFKVLTDAFLLTTPFTKPYLKAGFDNLRHKVGSAWDVTTTANPRVSKEMAVSSIIEEDGVKFADTAGTTVEAIVAEHVLPDYVERSKPKVEPDINDRLAVEFSDPDPRVQAKIDLLFDDNIINKQERLIDYERRANIHQGTKLYYNQANSHFNMIDTRLEGKMIFTQGPDYAFTTKKSVTNAVNELSKNILELETKDQGKVFVRDIKTNTRYTPEQFDKLNKTRGQFNVEWEFKKNYKLLDNEILGQGLADTNISFFGFGGNIGNALKRSVVGEFLFSTGTTAGWYERARAALSPKAGRTKSDITVQLNYLIDTNKPLHKDIRAMVNQMEVEGKDLFSTAELSRNHPELTTTQIAKLDEIQQAWRATQDALYDITNQGEKTRLINNGYDKGIYINNEYKGPVKQVFNLLDDEVPTKVLDFETGQIVDFKADKSKGNAANSKGQQLVKLDGKHVVDNAAVEYGLLSKNAELGILPQRVLNKLPGHNYKEYKSHFFVEVRPKVIELNGKVLQKGDPRYNEFVKVKGTATTRYEADMLVEQLKQELGGDFDILEPRQAKEGSLTDFTAEYKLTEDNYRNALSRNQDIRTVQGDSVLVDPLEALNNAANRISRTAAYSQFDKAFKEAYVRDFKPVLRGGEFPTSLDGISIAGKEASPQLRTMVKDAQMVWNRHTHFQNRAAGSVDRFMQNSLHGLADVFEKVKFKAGSDLARRTGDLGAYPITGFPKKLASLALITYQFPLRHMVIQPMMFYEQSIVFPATFKQTMKKTPIAVMELLSGHPMLREHGSRLKEFLSKEEQIEYGKEIKAMRSLGILESIDQNLAVMEVLKGKTVSLSERSTLTGKTFGALKDAGTATTNVFNRYGFTAGELTNRVGLFLQTKERWKASHPGERWDTPQNIQEIAFQSWKQSGAMTSSGALAFQRLPLLGFVTQFQAINLKGFMNLIQDNATNLSKVDRAKLTAARMLIHGVEYGTPLAGGKLLYDYFMSSEDENIVQNAELLRKGALDIITNDMMQLITQGETDFSLSESSSINATNFFADILKEQINFYRFVTGDPRVQKPNIPSVSVGIRAYERFQSAADIFAYNDVTGDSFLKSIGEIAQITSAGNNFTKAMTALAGEDLVTKNGYNKDLKLTTGEAFAQMAGFKTRRELDQWKIEELKMTREYRITQAVDGFDKEIIHVLKNEPSPEKFFAMINMQMSAMEKTGKFSSGEMDRIVKGIMERDRRRFDSDKTTSLINYIMNTDAMDADMRNIINRFSASGDPVVKDLVKRIKENSKPQQDIFKE